MELRLPVDDVRVLATTVVMIGSAGNTRSLVFGKAMSKPWRLDLVRRLK